MSCVSSLKRLLSWDFTLNQRGMCRQVSNTAVVLVRPSRRKAATRDALVDKLGSRNTKMGEQIIGLILTSDC